MDVINESNIIIQHSLDVISWFKDYKNVTLRRNLRLREPNASKCKAHISSLAIYGALSNTTFSFYYAPCMEPKCNGRQKLELDCIHEK